MLKRLALVLWWWGLLWGGIWGLAAAAGTYDNMSRGGYFVSALLASALAAPAAALAAATIPWWAVAFVLGGSFWRPPKP